MACVDPKFAWMFFADDGKYHLDFHPHLDKTHEEMKSLGYVPLAIPCRKCAGCRIDYAKDWAVRCQLESQTTVGDCWFVTLTYDDDHLNFAPVEDYMLPTLCKRDLQLFFKRLRKSGKEFRYFFCGEYGPKTCRPHYHGIMFGLWLDDLDLYSNKDGLQLYTSKFLTDMWKKGNVIFSRYSYATGAYIAKYITKSQFPDSAFDGETDCRQKPFLLMSRNPGIGRAYLDQHPDYIDGDRVYVVRGDRVVAVRPPKYSDYLLDKSDRDKLLSIKEFRRSVSSDPLELLTDSGQLALDQRSEHLSRLQNSRKNL